MTIFQFSAELL